MLYVGVSRMSKGLLSYYDELLSLDHLHRRVVVEEAGSLLCAFRG